MSDVIVAPAQRELEQLARTLEIWLACKLPEARDIRVTGLDYPRGAGQSHETILFDAAWREGGASLSQGMVVRIKPSSFVLYADDLFLEQYEIMCAIHASGAVPIARPLWLEVDASILGAPFFVMEKVTGRVPVSIPPYAEAGWVAEASASERRTMWESGVRNLAAIQNVPRDDLSFLLGRDGARQGLEQEFDRYVRLFEIIERERPWAVLANAIARLRSLWPDNQPAGLVWGDARIGNMMFGEDFRVIAVLDWEQPSLGGALHDLAWWIVNGETMHGATDRRPHLAGMGRREDTIALWQDVTGLSADGIEWYEDFTRFKMSCLSVRMASLRGSAPPDEAALARRLKVA
ncbi:MAG: phosphotransferase family protein [Pseudomonas sp.]|uniref:phosphotransferase family protein n=1 Tax=Pseudomonas sp. TaxID=306 RepID=UPI00120D1E82|nr:phosphotransferase family protein [Pseudomonas sp.]RZI76916.1 MAG: phosphotransferase family protein [Pseudomonas sp.]